MSVVFQFSPVNSYALDTASRISPYLQYTQRNLLSKVLPIHIMDQSARTRLPAPSTTSSQPSTSQSSQNQSATPLAPVPSLPVDEAQATIDQLGLVQSTLQEGAPPTLVTGMTMLIAQMQSLEMHPDFTLSISVGIGSYRRTAELHNGTWRGHDLTHHFDDHRSSMRYDEPARLPMEQLQPAHNNQSRHTPSFQQITCLLPPVPPPVLTPPPPSASISVRRLAEGDPELMRPSSFRGEGVEEMHTSAHTTDETSSQKPRTVMMRNPLDVPIMRDVIGVPDSYDALTPMTPTDPQHLIGFQADPDKQEQQKEQEQTERRAAKAPIDLRDILNRKEQNKIEQLVQKKRARELANSEATNSSPNPSPVQQPEARRVRFSELLSQTEARQYDIAARDAVRLQKEARSGNPDSGLDIQKFETASSKGNPEDVRNLERASIGIHYLRPVKNPTLLLDRIPPWFERVREDLHRDRSSLVKPLPSKVKLAVQRPARYDEQLMRSRDFMRDVTTLLPMGKEMLQKTRIALFMDSTMKATANMNNTLMDVRVMNLPCTSLEEMAEVTCKVFGPAANHAETIPFPPLLIYGNVIDHLALRGTLRYFAESNRNLTEEVMTAEVTAYIETMRNVIRRAQQKKPAVGVVFVSPPGYVYLPRPLQQLLYLISEAAYAQKLSFHIVAPNLRVSATTWRPCENSYSAFLAEISKALQACTGYSGNSQLLADDATAFDFGMQMAHRTFDENGVRQVKEPNGKERTNMIDNGWFERRDESTLDEKTHEAKFHKELLALFRETEKIKQNRTETTVFPVAMQAIDSKPNMVSPTLVLLVVLAQRTAKENRANPEHSYQSWHETLQKTLVEVAESHGIPFPIFLYNISPFWVPTMVSSESSLDEQQTKLYIEAMQRATIAEILAYLMAVGLSAVYKGPVHLVQGLILGKTNSSLLSFLIFAKNRRSWINAILNTLDPAGALKLRAQLTENVETMLAWIYSAWVNVSGMMSTLDDPHSQRRNDKNLPGFLFPSQVASLMLVETEDLIPLIAPIIWPIFGSVMALRYPTQPLRVAASAPTLSILHFVDPEDDARPPDFHALVRNFTNFRPPMAFTIIKDKKQVEYNFGALIRARARCAIPMPLELHPVEWLHAPVEPSTGALQHFTGWDKPGILRVLSNAVQRLGGRRKGSTPETLQHRVVIDMSRMYNPRAEPRADTANILSRTTHWADPPIVDRMIYQGYQALKATVPKIAKEPNREPLPLSEEIPNNPKMAMEIFMSLIAKQRGESNSVYTSYLNAVGTYREVFTSYGRQDLANQLPEACPAGSTSTGRAAGHEETSAAGNPTSAVSIMSHSNTTPAAAANTDVFISHPAQDNQPTHNITTTTSDDQAVSLDVAEDTSVTLSRLQAADIELELSGLPDLNQQEPSSSEALAVSLNEGLQEEDTVMDAASNK